MLKNFTVQDLFNCFFNQIFCPSIPHFDPPLVPWGSELSLPKICPCSPKKSKELNAKACHQHKSNENGQRFSVSLMQTHFVHDLALWTNLSVRLIAQD